MSSQEEVQSIVEEVRQAQADILFIAMGAPRQEYFIEDYGKEFGVKVAIGVGGSFDVVAGVVKRAPVLCQPSRWIRMMKLPRFVRLVKKTKKKQGS